MANFGKLVHSLASTFPVTGKDLGCALEIWYLGMLSTQRRFPMKKIYASGKLIVLSVALTLGITIAAQAGTGYDYSRGELMGNSGLTIFREADFGNQLGLSISIDGIPITTLSWGEGYRAIIRPGRHVLTVSDTPSPYGKTKFTRRTINLVPGQNYSFTAIWDVETILLEDGGYQHHGFDR
jgi:hypothetical protein